MNQSHVFRSELTRTKNMYNFKYSLEILMFSLFGLAGALLQSSTFQPISQLTNISESLHCELQNDLNLIQCAIECQTNAECNAFKYRENDETCQTCVCKVNTTSVNGGTEWIAFTRQPFGPTVPSKNIVSSLWKPT